MGRFRRRANPEISASGWYRADPESLELRHKNTRIGPLLLHEPANQESGQVRRRVGSSRRNGGNSGPSVQVVRQQPPTRGGSTGTAEPDQILRSSLRAQ